MFEIIYSTRSARNVMYGLVIRMQIHKVHILKLENVERSCKRVVCKVSSSRAAVFLPGISQAEECADALHRIAIARPRWLLNVSDLLFMGSSFYLHRSLGLLTMHHIHIANESRIIFFYILGKNTNSFEAGKVKMFR